MRRVFAMALFTSRFNVCVCVCVAALEKPSNYVNDVAYRLCVVSVGVTIA